jgi:hypothetical protein
VRDRGEAHPSVDGLSERTGGKRPDLRATVTAGSEGTGGQSGADSATAELWLRAHDVDASDPMAEPGDRGADDAMAQSCGEEECLSLFGKKSFSSGDRVEIVRRQASFQARTRAPWRIPRCRQDDGRA